jgi:hypothetical protein
MRKLVLALVLAGSFAGCESGTRIKSVEPNFGNVAGNDDIVINGSGFRQGMVIQFGKREAKGVVLEEPTRVRCKTPAGVEGKVDVSITRDDGKTFVLRDAFSYRRDAPGGK